jgi:hypothetical protein
VKRVRRARLIWEKIVLAGTGANQVLIRALAAKFMEKNANVIV